MKSKYFVDPVTHNQVRETGSPTAVFGGRLVWDGDREGLTLGEGIQGAELVCRLLNLGVSELPTLPERE